MDNSLIYITVIYLLIFRLSIVILGGISIILGYHLFAKGVLPPASTGSGGSEVGAQIGSINLTFKNAAPGSFFVVLGIVLVISMIMTAPPDAHFKTQTDPTTGVETREVGLRGDKETGECTAEQCKTIVDNVAMLGRAMNELAWTYYKEDKLSPALYFSKTAIKLVPENANIRDTLAEILFKKGKYAEAVEQMQKAVDLQEKAATTEKNQRKLEKYREKLKEYRKKVQ